VVGDATAGWVLGGLRVTVVAAPPDVPEGFSSGVLVDLELPQAANVNTVVTVGACNTSTVGLLILILSNLGTE
jgi:hypothetical protein